MERENDGWGRVSGEGILGWKSGFPQRAVTSGLDAGSVRAWGFFISLPTPAGEAYNLAQMRVVFDTSVLVAAARSRNGASFALVAAIPAPRFEICLSVGLYAEWQDVLSRPEHLPPGRTAQDARKFLRFLAGHAHLQDIFFLWRPFLSDPDDDMILELAFAAGCRYIVTHNVRDFRGCDQLGTEAITPREFLAVLKQTTQP